MKDFSTPQAAGLQPPPLFAKLEISPDEDVSGNLYKKHFRHTGTGQFWACKKRHVEKNIIKVAHRRKRKSIYRQNSMEVQSFEVFISYRTFCLVKAYPSEVYCAMVSDT